LKKIDVIDDLENKFEVEAPLDISIEEFKRILLNINNKPFFFEFYLENYYKLKDLIDKSKGPIKIYYNLYEFNLVITDYFDHQNQILILKIT
jgi:hypothetical protein